MIKNIVLEMVNRDNKLLALFSGMLVDGILLIALIVYISTHFI